MVKKNIKIISIVLVMILIILSATTVFAIDNPEAYKPTIESSGKFISMGGKIIKYITIIGILVGTVTLAIIGFKFMLGSAAEKAKYKETIFPYIVGCLLLVGTSTLLNVIMSLVS